MQPGADRCRDSEEAIAVAWPGFSHSQPLTLDGPRRNPRNLYIVRRRTVPMSRTA